jgi:hypothetical protein
MLNHGSFVFDEIDVPTGNTGQNPASSTSTARTSVKQLKADMVAV